MKVLVTGGAGFIGSHMVEELLNRGFSVVVLDDLSTGKLENLPAANGSLRFIKGSILDRIKVAEAIHDCDAVIHLAAIASVQASIDHPLQAHQVNFDGTLHLLEAARKAGTRRFLFASSASVYGGGGRNAISEDDPVAPMTPYAIDKLAGEYYLKHYLNICGLNFTAFRFFNVYGSRQNSSSPYSGVISIFTANSIAGKPIKIYGDGGQTRDFVYVRDVCKILVTAIDTSEMYGRILNVGTGHCISVLDLVEKIGIVIGRKVTVEQYPARTGEVRHSLASVNLLRSMGYLDEMTPILHGLKKTIADSGIEKAAEGT